MNWILADTNFRKKLIVEMKNCNRLSQVRTRLQGARDAVRAFLA